METPPNRVPLLTHTQNFHSRRCHPVTRPNHPRLIFTKAGEEVLPHRFDGHRSSAMFPHLCERVLTIGGRKFTPAPRKTRHPRAQDLNIVNTIFTDNRFIALVDIPGFHCPIIEVHGEAWFQGMLVGHTVAEKRNMAAKADEEDEEDEEDMTNSPPGL
jgi:hypothetical protein